MKILHTVLAVGMVLLLAAPVMAIEILIDENGNAPLRFSFTEPSENVDGSPLTDLKSCTVSVDVIGDSGGDWKTLEIPATSPGGGGKGLGQIVFPIPDPSMVTGLQGRVYCSDLSGNHSALFPPDGPLAVELVLIVPDNIAPGTPFNFIFEVN